MADLEQNLREDLIFGLFAADDAKADLKWIKEEELKRKFKHWWVVQLCNFMKYYIAVTEDDDFDLEEEYGNNAAHATACLVRDLSNAGYESLSCKLVKSMFQDMDLVITEKDLH